MTYFMIVEKNDLNGYTAHFPDVEGCITEGDTFDEVMENGKEALELHLYSVAEMGEALPNSRPFELIDVEEEAVLVAVHINFAAVCSEMAWKKQNKTVSLPKWLIAAADEVSVNYSKLLEKSLYEELDLTDRLVEVRLEANTDGRLKKKE